MGEGRRGEERSQRRGVHPPAPPQCTQVLLRPPPHPHTPTHLPPHSVPRFFSDPPPHTHTHTCPPSVCPGSSQAADLRGSAAHAQQVAPAPQQRKGTRKMLVLLALEPALLQPVRRLTPRPAKERGEGRRDEERTTQTLLHGVLTALMRVAAS